MDAILGPTPQRAVEVTGADRASYLEAVLSQRIEGVEPGRVASALHLDVHGSPLAVLDVVVLHDRLVLVVPEELAEEVVRVLGGRTFLADARFELLDADVAAVRGARTRAAIGAFGEAPEPGHVVELDDVLAIGHDHGVDLVGPTAALRHLADALEQRGVERADAETVAAWDLAEGVPRWGSEITSGQLPEELGLLPTHVHLAKGCYPGQEAVARMWQLGRPRRRLAVVEPGDGVEAGWEAGSGRRRVRVTRTAELDGRRLAFAFVPGDADEGERYEDEAGQAIVVRTLVGAGRKVPGHDPSVARRRDRR